MEVVNALGRRKSAVARIFVTEGTGKITINKRDLAEYFPSSILQYVDRGQVDKDFLLFANLVATSTDTSSTK